MSPSKPKPRKPTRKPTGKPTRKPTRVGPQLLLPTLPSSTAATRRLGEELIADVAMRRERIAKDFYEIGASLQQLSRKRVYRALGFDNFDALLKERGILGRMQATKLIAVTQAYPRDLALDLGIETAYALLRYTAATPAADVAHRLAAGNTKIGGKRISELTATDIRKETKRLTAAPRPTDAETRNARGIARRLQQTLRRKGAPSAVIRAERQGAKWKLLVEVDLDEGEILQGR